MPTYLQPRLHEMIDRKKSDLEYALSHHKELLVGIDAALQRSSDSLALRVIELEDSCGVIERIYGELILLSEVAGVGPPEKPAIERGH